MPDISPRFWAKVRRGVGCWEWTAYRNAGGYGCFAIGRKFPLAHRVSWEMHRGPIPDGLCVLHRCDNPPCVNPAHLFLGDRTANNADMKAKGRGVNPIALAYAQRSHCDRGHEYTEENTRLTGHGRQCRACARIMDNARHIRDHEKRLAAMRRYHSARRVA